MGRLARLLWLAGFAIGIAAESVAFGWVEPRRWVPDLAVGWTFIGLGLVATDRWPDNRTGHLLVLTGFTWFAGNFASTDIPIVAWLAGQTSFVYRGALVHLVLAYPTGRLPDHLSRGVALVAYAASLVGFVASSDVVAIGLGVLLLVATARAYARSVGAARRARTLALRASAALALLLMGSGALSLVGGTAVGTATSLGYQVALCGLAGGLFVGLLGRTWERAEVTDLVVGMSEGQAGTLRGELSAALGDPSLELGYWAAEQGEYVDADGRGVTLPPPTSERAVTLIGRGDVPVAALVHDPVLLDEPGLFESVASAARLAASNAELQAELQMRVADLAASRQRLLRARDGERERLERRLQDGAEARLDRLARLLATGAASGRSETAKDAVANAQRQLERTKDDLGRLASGLHPRTLSERGLGEALRALSNDSPLEVRFVLPAQGLPGAAQTVAYFVVSEALANAAKHAVASRVDVTVTVMDSYALITVEDDGRGGADPHGSGLRGLADRVATAGGSLQVDSAPNMGTRLAAKIPLDGEAR